MKYLIISKTKWNKRNFKNLSKNVKFLDNLNLKFLKKYNPKIIFFIHWSIFVPKKIYSKYLCIQFHSSDLPRFRGGSPIQNQIIRGVKKTKITAFKITERIDSGPICLQKKVDLNGSAQTIYERIEKKCLTMISLLIKRRNIVFKNQKGKSSFFKRRKPKQSNLKIQKNLNLNKILDFINMLDAKNYPKAYIDIKNFKISFESAKLVKKEEIEGVFKINKK